MISEISFANTGDANQNPSSPIKGYRRTPNSTTFLKYFRRRPHCDAILVPEHRTTMLCSLCRKVMERPNNQPKHRYRTCLDCKPKPDCLPSTAVNTIISKRKLQRLRKKEKNRRAGVAAADEDIAMREVSHFYMILSIHSIRIALKVTHFF